MVIFMDGLAHQTIKNSIWSFLGFVWPMILSFVAMPIIIREMGSSMYGFYVLLNASLTVFGLLDFGLGYTFTKKLSENPGDFSDELNKLFSSTFFAYLCIGLLIFLISIFLPNLFKNILKIPDGFISSFSLIFLIVGITFLFKMILVPIALIPYALQRNDIMAKICLVNITLIQVASIIAVLMGYKIAALVLIQLFSVIFPLILYSFYWKKLLPSLKLKLYFSLNIFRGIAKDGIWPSIANVAMIVFTQLDKFVVSVFLGPTAVTYYSSSQMLPEKINATSFSLSFSFFPIFSNISFLDKIERVKTVFRRSLKILSLIAAGLALMVLIYGYPFLKYWLGEEIADHARVAINYLALTYFLFSLSNITGVFLGGLRKLEFLAFNIVIMAFLDTIFMFLLIPHYGINGAAMAYLISALPMIFFIYYIEKKYLNGNFSEIISFYIKNFLKILVVGLVVYLMAQILFLRFASSLLFVVLIGGFTFVIYILMYKLFGFFEKEDVDLFRQFFLNYLNRFKITRNV